MVALSPNIPVITLNINSLKHIIKRKTWPQWIKETKKQVFAVCKKLTSNIIGRLSKSKDMKNICHKKKLIKIKSTQMAILISDNLDFRRKKTGKTKRDII